MAGRFHTAGRISRLSNLSLRPDWDATTAQAEATFNKRKVDLSIAAHMHG